jgi:hypothetical protein
MAKITVKGAGDSMIRDNPKVTSKFDRSHGMPRVPGHVEKIGGVAKPGAARSGGASVSYDEHSGHQMPREREGTTDRIEK